MENKFELTDITKEINGRVLYQIRALKDFGRVKKGDLGGWIEKEESLSQKGNAWVHVDVIVYKLGKIHGGEIHGGEIHGGVIWGGEIHGGEIHGGVIWGGEIHGGVIWGGEIHGGVIKLSTDYLIIGPLGSRDAILTVTFSDKMIATGCFHGDLETFEKKVNETHTDNNYAVEYLLVVELIKKLFEARKNK